MGRRTGWAERSGVAGRTACAQRSGVAGRTNCAAFCSDRDLRRSAAAAAFDGTFARSGVLGRCGGSAELLVLRALKQVLVVLRALRQVPTLCSSASMSSGGQLTERRNFTCSGSAQIGPRGTVSVGAHFLVELNPAAVPAEDDRVMPLAFPRLDLRVLGALLTVLRALLTESSLILPMEASD